MPGEPRSPEFLRSRARTAVPAAALAALIAAPGLAGGGDVIWETTAAPSYGCPQIAAHDGRVFTFALGTRETEGGTASFPVVRAYDVASGSAVWESTGGDGFNPGEFGPTGIAAAAGRVFTIEQVFPGSFLPPGPAAISAYDAASGAPLWRQTIPSGEIEQHVLHAVAAGNGVAVVVGTRLRESAPGERRIETMVRAYDGRTGELLWEDSHDRSPDLDEARVVVVRRQRVIVASTAWFVSSPPMTVIRAHSATTGALLWQREETGHTARTADLRRGRLVVLTRDLDLTHGALLAYDVRTGRELWQRRVPNALPDSLELGGVRVFVYGQRQLQSDGRSRLRAYDARSGRPLWGASQSDANGQQVVAAGGGVFTIGRREIHGLSLNAYEARSGRPLWSGDALDPERVLDGCRLALEQRTLVTTARDESSAVIRALEP